jgi:serine/threonine-protein kinase
MGMTSSSGGIIVDSDVGLAMDGLPGSGDLLAGRYRIERVLGCGGMGIVVSAFHEILQQRVAVKFLAPLAKDTVAAARFINEARAAATLHNEHALRVMDVGALDNGVPYMVLEFLDGTDLSERLDRGRVPHREAVDYLLQALEAIAEAHARGLIHRDLKPSNLFLAKRPDGSRLVKVLDFGISKQIGGTPGMPRDLTGEGTLLGTPAYMSPEQIRNAKGADARSDIWSIGVVLYELLTGVKPFGGEVSTEILAKILETTPTPVRSIVPEVPAELDELIARCLSRRPEDRFSDVAALARALAPHGSERAAISLASIEGVLGIDGRAADKTMASRSLDDPSQAPVSSAATQDPRVSLGRGKAARSLFTPARLGVVALLLALVATLAWAALRPRSDGAVVATPEAQSAASRVPAAAASPDLPARLQATSGASTAATSAAPSQQAPPSIKPQPRKPAASASAAPRDLLLDRE